MYRLTVYDRVTLKSRVMKSRDTHRNIIIAAARSAILWSEHGRHIVFVDNGFNMVDDNGKVIRAFRIEIDKAQETP